MEIKTKTDEFIEQQLRAVLRPGEVPVAFGYLDTLVGGRYRGIPMAAFHAALTDQRLILIETRIGAFGNLLENTGVRSLDPAGVKGVSTTPELLFELADGTIMTFRNNRSAKHTSSQAELFERLEPFFGSSEAAAQRNLARRRSVNYYLSDWRVVVAMLVVAMLGGIGWGMLHRR